jgi:hypothetical protein
MTTRHWQCRLFFESEREARMPLQNQSAKLKKLFSKRVTNQARIVLDSYQKCKESDWLEKDRLNNLYDAAEKLKHSAERFEMLEQHEIANKIYLE